MIDCSFRKSLMTKITTSDVIWFDPSDTISINKLDHVDHPSC